MQWLIGLAGAALVTLITIAWKSAKEFTNLRRDVEDLKEKIIEIAEPEPPAGLPEPGHLPDLAVLSRGNKE